MSERFHGHGRTRRVVIVGGGFAGFHAACTVSRLVNRRGRRPRWRAERTEIVVINPTDYFPLPTAAAGGGGRDPRPALRRGAPDEPRAGRPADTGTVDEVDINGRRVGLADPEEARRAASYDRLLLTAGSVGKLLPIPGVAEHALGFRSIGEALALREHVVRQVELAAAATGAASRLASAEREARCTFVVVGAG
jgi:NADH dehydrogenase